jgi:choline dehydrogenase-like flavoprotein
LFVCRAVISVIIKDTKSNIDLIGKQAMTFLSHSEQQTLTTICDTFIPAVKEGDALNGFHEVGLSARVEEAFERATDPAQQRELKLLLQGFEYSLVNGLMAGRWKSFSRMTPGEREQALTTWAHSQLGLRRKAFQSLKRLILFLGYSNRADGSTHPVWQKIDYPGAPGGGDAPRTIKPLVVQADQTLDTDVLVIGSGAGGGVIAGELTAAGRDVIVVEKGGYHAETDFDGNELSANERLFERYGALTTKDVALSVLAGATLGGGTTVNWSASFRTPEHVLQEWAQDYGFTDATSATYQRSLDAVHERMNINTDESHANPNNRLFEDGCQKLGYQVGVIPRNVKGCEECGFCNYGCSFGAKQGTLKTYLQDAHDRGARILVNARVMRVLHSGGKATGAVIEAQGADGKIYTVTVRAKLVVVAAGSLHTPVLLQRSGLQNPHIGDHLHLHPVAVIFSLFDEQVRMWRGVPMSRVSRQFADMDGKGYGVTLEVAPAHPGITAASLPWTSAHSHRQLVAQMAHMANLLTITRDYYGGRITADKRGDPVVNYTLHPYDRAHLQRGLLEALKIHRAAGAKVVYAPHNAGLCYDGNGNDQQFAQFLRRVEEAGLPPNAFPMFSAHQMSSCRIAASPSQGALKPTGETHEIANLFVADGSALPTATGVNPMVSIMGLAHYIAQQVKAKISN